MKLAAKLIASVVLGIVLIVTIDTFVSVRREVSALEHEMAHEAKTLGEAFRGLIADVWRANGPSRVFELIKDADESKSGISIRWVWFDSHAATETRPRAPLDDLKSMAAEHRIEVIRESGSNGHGVLITYVPIEAPGSRLGGLELTQSRERLDGRIQSTIKKAVFLSGTMVVIGGLAVLLIGFALIGRPLRMIIEKTKRIGEGDLDGLIDLQGRDELSLLADSLNDMCAKIADAQQRAETETEARIAVLEDLRHADRLTTVGRLASGVAHELGTPLNVITGRASMIASGRLSSAQIDESAVVIKKQGERMTSIIRQLLDFGRRRAPKRSTLSLQGLISETVALVGPLCGAGTQVVMETDEDVEAEVDPAQIQQALINLVINGVQSMTGGGTVRIRLSRDSFVPPDEAIPVDCVRVDVCDEGPGIPDEDFDRLFEPFFTTKEVGVGTGLGLSVAHGIVTDHGGWILVESTPGRGSRFSIVLPGVVPDVT